MKNKIIRNTERQMYYKCFVMLMFALVLSFFSSQHSVAAPIVPNGFVLQIEHSPAVCRLDSSKKRNRECLAGYGFTITSFLPLGVNYSQCTTSSSIYLTPVQRRLLLQIMPSESEQIRLWRNVGNCVAMNASQYFRMVLNVADRLNMPPEVAATNSIVAKREYLVQRFVQFNKGMSSNSVRLICQNQRGNSILTRVQVCYQNNGAYKACTFPQNNSCGARVYVQGLY